MTDKSSFRLWYDAPATEWNQALPIGNGRLGAMIFGATARERLQLNEESLWSGVPHDYSHVGGAEVLPEIRRLVFADEWQQAQKLINDKFMGVPVVQSAYQTVGNLLIDFDADGASEYSRSLDLDTATATTTYILGGVRYTRTYFASYPDDVIVMRIVADKPGAVTITARFETPQKGTSTTAEAGVLTLSSIRSQTDTAPNRIHFQAAVRILPEGKNAQLTRGENNTLTVSNADAVTLHIGIATAYNSYKDISGDAVARVQKRLESVRKKSYNDLYRSHVADYQPLFRRVSLDMGDQGKVSDRPTNARVADFDRTNDPALVALHFQYGRYLLIASSRPGNTQPANLQGIWNEHMTPPWGSKFTVNINTEMNYWHAGPANLLECYEPLLRLIHDISETGKNTAKIQYGAKGWVCHHNVDAWRGTAPVDGAFWGTWQTGGAWLCKSFRDYFDFTGDMAILDKAYPVLKGATEFFLDALVPDPKNGHLVTCPAVSPENAHHPGSSVCAGPTMDNQILHDLFDTVIIASERLGKDAAFRSLVKSTREKLPPMEVGAAGQLQEWQEDWDAIAPEKNHRHVSHLYGLYPSDQITPEHTPQLFAAARKSLEQRGDMATGWSLAWKINLWARLRDGDRAYTILRGLLTPERTAPNLFDLHPPFQIDGNFGATSGVCEMLLQSHGNELHLLPALPSLWKSGTVRGLLARGGYEVGLTWADGKLTQATIKARQDGTCRVRYGDKVIPVAVKKGKSVKLDKQL